MLMLALFISSVCAQQKSASFAAPSFAAPSFAASGATGGPGGAQPQAVNFTAILTQSVPVSCQRSPCMFISSIPWNKFNKVQCLNQMTSLETCLAEEEYCRMLVEFKGPRVCCDGLQGGNGRVVNCSSDAPSTISVDDVTPTTAADTSASAPVVLTPPPAGKAGKAGKAKGKVGKAKAKSAGVAPTPVPRKPAAADADSEDAGRPTISAPVRPTISPPCPCLKNITLVPQDVDFDKTVCDQQVSTMQQCLTNFGCVAWPELQDLSACCDLLPGGSGYNPSCSDPTTVLSNLLESSQTRFHDGSF